MNYKQTSPEELILELEKLTKENESLRSSYQAFKDECDQSMIELHKSEKMHRSLFEISFQGIVYQNKDGQILDANPAAQKILGLTLDQMQGRTSYDPRWQAIKEDGTNFPGDEHPAMISLKTGKIIKDTMMGVFNPVDEKLHWISINASPLFNEGETSPDMVYTVFDDVTERKETEKKLQESVDRYHLLAENATDFIWVFDLDTNSFTYQSPSVERLLGYTTEELHEFGFFNTFAGQSKEIMLSVIPERIELFRNGQAVFFTDIVEQVHKNGSTVWVETNSQIKLNPKTNHVEATGLARNITGRKMAEMEITRQNGLIIALLDSIPDIIFYKDKNGVYLGCNQALAEFVGKKRIDIIGKTDYDLFDKETAAFFKYHDNKMFEELQPCNNEEWITYPDGRKALVDTLKTPYWGQDGSLIGILGISRDITTRKQAEEISRERETLLQMAQKIVDYV